MDRRLFFLFFKNKRKHPGVDRRLFFLFFLQVVTAFWIVNGLGLGVVQRSPAVEKAGVKRKRILRKDVARKNEFSSLASLLLAAAPIFLVCFEHASLKKLIVKFKFPSCVRMHLLTICKLSTGI